MDSMAVGFREKDSTGKGGSIVTSRSQKGIGRTETFSFSECAVKYPGIHAEGDP
jgi:ribosomal protein L34